MPAPRMKQYTYNNNYILLIAFVSGLGGYLFGFDFAVITGALPFLRVEFGLDAWWEGFLTGSLAIGCMVGCVVAGNLADRYGRKPGLLVAALVFAFSSVGMALASTLQMFVAMRFIAGIGVGMASILSPMYIAEVSPAEIRGRNVTINQLTVVFGILVTNLVNYFLAGTGEEAWRWMFGLGAAPAILFLFGVVWLPESPRWLLRAGQDTKARAILNKIGNAEYVHKTVYEIKQSMQGERKESFKALFHKAVLPAVLIGSGLAVFQQFCGINVVFNYTSTIFESVGAGLDRQLFEMVAIGFVNLVFTFVAMWQVDKLGRKPLMLFGSAGLTILHVIIAILLYKQDASIWLSIVVLAAISVYATSLAPITWVLISEIFPNKVRGIATSVAVLALWAAYFVVVFTFPILAKRMGTYGPFWMYAVVCALGFLFVFFKVKETKGKTLEELEGVFVAH